MIAVISSMFSGFNPKQTPVMPLDSIWNTPEVLPAVSMANTSGSSMGMSSKRKSGSFCCTIFTASSSTVRFRRPKKSIFNRPSSSSVIMLYWHTMASSFRARGTYSYTGRLVMTTPAAWVLAWRGMPSSDLAVSMSFFTLGSDWYMSFSCLLIFSASSSVMCSALGTSLATTSTSA